MTDFTPSEAQIREALLDTESLPYEGALTVAEYEALIDRFFADRDRTVAAKALRDAARTMNTEVMDPWDWLRDEADRIEQNGEGQ